MALTPKQELAARLKAEGKDQSTAYRGAYDVSPDCKPETIWEEASRLFAIPEVSARVDEIRLELAAKSLWTREDSVRELKEAVLMAKDANQITALTGAVKELNVMHGYNEPTKLDLSNSDGSLKSQGVDFSKLSSAALAELLALKDAAQGE